jgi:hypothetical protein
MFFLKGYNRFDFELSVVKDKERLPFEPAKTTA